MAGTTLQKHLANDLRVTSCDNNYVELLLVGVHDSLNLLCAHQLTDSFFRLKDQIVALGIDLIWG